MAVLYRKYRPQTFSEVVNQKHIIQTLKNQVKSGAVSHAYLFTGSRGVGKTSIARILAKALNCLHQGHTTPSADAATPPLQEGSTALGDACGVCEVCKQVEAGNFLDLVEIDAASNTGVENVRDLIEHVKFAPSLGKYKVFIIDEVHMLSKQAFNALLKTLEEPPKHAVFILATTEINKVLPTIISRTQRFDFKALSEADILAHLEHICAKEGLKFSKDVLQFVAQAAEGSVRDALSLLDKVSGLSGNAGLEEFQQLLGITDLGVCEKLLELIAGGQMVAIPEFFDGLLQTGQDFKILNRDFLEYLRKGLVFKASGNTSLVILPEDRLKKLSELVGQLSMGDLMFTIRLFLRSHKDLETFPSAEIPLLLAALEAASRKNAKAPEMPTKADQKATELQNSSTVVERPSAVVKSPTIENTIQSAPEPEVSAVTLSLDEIQGFWPKVISKIKEVNGPLSSMLRAARLQEIIGNKIVVGVKFLFDKQNLENAKNTQVISVILEQVCGTKLSLSAQVIKEIKPDGDPALVLTDALKVFGGELVE